jgi:molybdopterin-guanine dinucleotide biosynthesis protein A
VKIAGVILAGGQSKRMGSDKSQLIFGNQTLLGHCQNILEKSNLDQVYISGVQGIKDTYKNVGPIGGIYSCLLELTDYDHVVFMPVDMPFLTDEIINKLIYNPDSSIVNFVNNNLPLMIKNNSSIRHEIEKQIKNNKLSLYELFSILDAKVLSHTFHKKSFANINSPNQWQEALNKLLIASF